MGDLIEFLNARLDEDEATAKAAWGIEWSWRDLAQPFRERSSIAHTVHIARHDPARVLREVAAKRAILASVGAIPHEYVEDCFYSCPLAIDPSDPAQEPGSGFCNEAVTPEYAERCQCGRDAFVGRMAGYLAAIYSDHPDYDPAWSPDAVVTP